MYHAIHLAEKRLLALWLNALRIFFMVFFMVLAGGLAFMSAYSIVASTEDVEVSMTSKKEIAPKDSITVAFNQAVEKNAVEEKIKISPSVETTLHWSKDGRELELRPEHFFEPGEKYELEMTVPAGFFKKKTREFKFSFRVEDFPQVFKVEAESAEDEELTKIKSDFNIYFDKSTRGYDVTFDMRPNKNFLYEVNEERTIFRIYSNDDLEHDTEYQMAVTVGLSLSDKKVKAPEKTVYSGSFRTEKKKPPIKKTPSPVVEDSEVVDHEARIEKGKYIDINLSEQHLSIFSDGERMGTYRISSGKRGMATPTGTFKVIKKTQRAWSHKYKLYMPFWMQFTGAGHGIHELPEWPGGYKEGVNHLGIPVSHGCVRLGVGPAETAYNFSEIGTPVVIHY